MSDNNLFSCTCSIFTLLFLLTDLYMKNETITIINSPAIIINKIATVPILSSSSSSSSILILKLYFSFPHKSVTFNVYFLPGLNVSLFTIQSKDLFLIVQFS